MSLNKLIIKTQRYHLIVLFAILALLSLIYQPQHSISISRYQHYAIAIALLSAGYTGQALLNWQAVSTWTRFCYLATGAFFASVAIIFFFNPWLDYKVAVQTEERHNLRSIWIYSYMCLSLALSGIWLKLAHEETQKKRKSAKSVAERQDWRST